MKCDHCQHDAVVHETVIVSGVARSIHLCALHAVQKGYLPKGKSPPGPVAKVQFKAYPAQESKSRCRGCGLTVAEFRKSGTLGCPACYDAFGPFLASVIERSQAGATRHCGGAPDASSAEPSRTAQRERLMQSIREALAAEQYEVAAQLRDRLRSLEGRERQ